MKRSQFCKSLIAPGIACSCAIAYPAGSISGSTVKPDSVRNTIPGGTPCAEKMDFTHKWVKRFFDILDENIDEETRVKLMQANGAACAKGAYGELKDESPATIEEIDNKIAQWQQRLGKENIHRQGNIIYFNYVGNPDGVKISDGYCLCPMIEDGPPTLSPTYCQCSVGYVKYMFRRMITFKPVEVELLESLRGGGKACRFKVMI
jgi:hypothetical protein